MTEILRFFYNKLVFTASKLRATIYKSVCLYIGPNVDILSGVRILCPGKVSIGKNTTVNIYTTLDGNGGLTIGDDVMIGPYCQILTASHIYASRTIPMKYQGISTASVVIGNDVWLGSNVTILPGVAIGHGAIIGASSVVTRNISPFEIAAGVPAKIIGIRPI